MKTLWGPFIAEITDLFRVVLVDFILILHLVVSQRETYSASSKKEKRDPFHRFTICIILKCSVQRTNTSPWGVYKMSLQQSNSIKHFVFHTSTSLKNSSSRTELSDWSAELYRPVWITYFVDHVECTLEHSVKDLRYLTGDVPPQLVDNCCHGAEDLGLTGGRDVALIVNQDRIEQRWYKVLPHLE